MFQVIVSLTKIKTMNLVNLGKTQLEIPPIAFGGNVLGWTADKEESFKLLDALLEKGFNYIDTANVYSRWADGHEGGESETVLGEWMKARGNRDKIIIATKVGMDMGQGHIDLSPNHIQKQIDDSLKRLQTDYVDVYFSHKDDEETPVEKTIDTYKKLIDAGKIKYIGASNFSLPRLMESLDYSEKNDLPRYEVYQPEYNLMRRDKFEGAVRGFCMEKNISVTSYFTLAAGFLTGKYEDREDAKGADREKHVNDFFDAKGKRVIEALKEIAKAQNSSPAAVAIAWTMAQPGITAPIASASKMSQLDSFFQAAELRLSDEQIQHLSEASENE